METKFTMDNTAGYTQAELDKLNEELEKILTDSGYETGTDMYYQEAKRFAHEVNKRG